MIWKYKIEEKYQKNRVINNLTKTTDGLIVIRTTSASVAVSNIGAGVIVVPINACVGFATAFTTKMATHFLKHKEQKHMKCYLASRKTLKRFQEQHTKSLGDNNLDRKNAFAKLYNNS